MKLSDIKGEQALDVLADILEPAANIVKDEEFRKYANSGNKLGAVKCILKNHKKEIIEILARVNMKEPDEYEFSLISLPLQVLNLMNDPEVMLLFRLQGQKEEGGNSGSVTENTEATAQK